MCHFSWSRLLFQKQGEKGPLQGKERYVEGSNNVVQPFFITANILCSFFSTFFLHLFSPSFHFPKAKESKGILRWASTLLPFSQQLMFFFFFPPFSLFFSIHLEVTPKPGNTTVMQSNHTFLKKGKEWYIELGSHVIGPFFKTNNVIFHSPHLLPLLFHIFECHLEWCRAMPLPQSKERKGKLRWVATLLPFFTTLTFSFFSASFPFFSKLNLEEMLANNERRCATVVCNIDHLWSLVYNSHQYFLMQYTLPDSTRMGPALPRSFLQALGTCYQPTTSYTHHSGSSDHHYLDTCDLAIHIRHMDTAEPAFAQWQQ